jgi:pentatricopeptide repeat protein
LHKLEHLVYGRDQNFILGEYMAYLKDASVRGAWKDALRIYQSMIKRGFHPNQSVFMYLIVACKNGEPCQASVASEVLFEMQRQGFSTDVKTYNTVIDACRVACQWRRALTVFKSMNSNDIKPNTATYSVLTEACTCARLDEAPAVYETMKFCGCPESLAYSTAQKIFSLNGGGKVGWL